MIPEEISAGLKAKYPQYKDVPDEVLLPKLFEKHPVYQKLLTISNAPEPSQVPEDDFLRRQVPAKLATSPNLIAQATGKILSSLPYQDYSKPTTPEEMTDVVMNASPFGMGSVAKKIVQRSGLEIHLLDLLKKNLPTKGPALMALAEKDPVQAVKAGLPVSDWPKIDRWLNELKNLGHEGPELEALARTKAKVLIDEVNGIKLEVPSLPSNVVIQQPKTSGQITAAVRDPQTGQVYTGPSHNEIMASVTDPNAKRAVMREVTGRTENTGFVDSDGQFINRQQAQEKYGFSTSEELAAKGQPKAQEAIVQPSNALEVPSTSLLKQGTQLYRGAPSANLNKGSFEGTWMGTDQRIAETYGKVHSFKVTQDMKLLDAEADFEGSGHVGSNVQKLLTEFYTKHPELDINANLKYLKKGDMEALDEIEIETFAFPDPKFIKFLKEKGYEGYYTNKDTGIGRELFLFNKKGVQTPKQAVIQFNKEMTKTPNVDPFYSKLQKVLEEPKIPDNMPSQGLINTLLKQQVKPDEIKWSGLAKFLEGKNRVTKAEVQQYLKENDFRVNEIDFGVPIKSKKEGFTSTTETTPKYGPETHPDLQIPGATRHEETLYQLPQKTKTVPGNIEELFPTPMHQFRGDVIFIDITGGQVRGTVATGWKYVHPTGEVVTLSNPGVSNAAEAQTKALVMIPGLKEKVPTKQVPINVPFQGGHYDEPNVIVHVLRDEIKIGKDKVSLLNEKQSDWHQQGGQEGYGLREVPRALKNWMMQRMPKADPYKITPSDLQSRDAPREVLTAFYTWQRKSFVPDAPFKKNWNLLVDKREIRRAVERKQDGLAWPAGEVIADRYKLTKKLDELHYKKNADGTFNLGYTKKGNWEARAWHENVKKENLKDMIGEDATRKVLEGKGTKAHATKARTSHTDMTLNAKDLDEGSQTIGGLWHKKMYDEKFVNDLNAFVKPWGAKMEKIIHTPPIKTLNPTQRNELKGTIEDLRADDMYELDVVQDELAKVGLKGSEKLINYWESMNRDPYTKLTVSQMMKDVLQEQKEIPIPIWYLKFTPALKRAALKEGFPLFTGLGALGLVTKEASSKKKE